MEDLYSLIIYFSFIKHVMFILLEFDYCTNSLKIAENVLFDNYS